MDNSKPKIAMITMCIGAEYQKKWESAARSKEIYCKMHGYDFLFIKISSSGHFLLLWQFLILNIFL